MSAYCCLFDDDDDHYHHHAPRQTSIRFVFFLSLSPLFKMIRSYSVVSWRKKCHRRDFSLSSKLKGFDTMQKND